MTLIRLRTLTDATAASIHQTASTTSMGLEVSIGTIARTILTDRDGQSSAMMIEQNNNRRPGGKSPDALNRYLLYVRC